TDCRYRWSDRPHAKWRQVHRAALHRAAEKPAQFFAHLVWIFPIICRPGIVLRIRANKSAIFHPRHVGRIRTRVKAARPQLLVQLDKRAARDELIAELVVLLLRTIHPMNFPRARKFRHLLHPTKKVVVFAQRHGWIAGNYAAGGHLLSPRPFSGRGGAPAIHYVAGARRKSLEKQALGSDTGIRTRI